MSKKQEQHQNQQQQQHQNLLLRESQKRRGHGRAGSIARASLTVSLDNADTVIEGGPPIPIATLNHTYMRGAPFFRVLCGRVGGENIRSELSISVPDRKLHKRVANHANRQFRGPLFIIDHKRQTR